MKTVTENVYYVGVDDTSIDFFEGMYRVPDGVSYNSYIIKDEKTAVFDSVDARFCDVWLKNVEAVLCGSAPDYIIVQHMEPDHSACIKAFTDKYPSAVVVGNTKTFVMLSEYFGEDYAHRRVAVNDGDELSLGAHTLKFIFAPMVHWPEVMFTYDKLTGTLYSADAFGKFGALSASCDDWTDEARRYYTGIVGKYGVQVGSALKKLGGLDITAIAPLHGPVLSGGKLDNALSSYSKWSAYMPEEKGVLIAFSSVYGHTAQAAMLLLKELFKRGVKAKAVDLIREDWAECVAQAFRFSGLVVATTTYNADIFPAAREFIDRLTERNYQNRVVAFVENGTWAPVCAAKMKVKFDSCKNIVYAENGVKIRSALNDESVGQLCALADELSNLTANNL